MVGYKEGDLMTSNQKLIAAIVSGVATRFITQPMDVIKIRTQLVKHKPNPKKKWFRITRKIIKHEGLLAFWHGHNVGQVHSVLSVGSQFFTYEVTTKWVSNFNIDKAYVPHLKIICGIIAGCCSATVVMPLEVIRVRQMMVAKQYRGMLRGAKQVYASGGLLAFYEGLSAGLLQMGPQVGLSFFVFNVVQPLVLNSFDKCEVFDKSCSKVPGNPHRPESLLMASTIAGCCAGFCSKSLTYPFDLIKRRLQLAVSNLMSTILDHFITYQSHKNPDGKKAKHIIRCKNLTTCIYRSLKEDGFAGLYRGWKVTIYKAQLTSVVAFTSYELLCYSIREMAHTVEK